MLLKGMKKRIYNGERLIHFCSTNDRYVIDEIIIEHKLIDGASGGMLKNRIDHIIDRKKRFPSNGGADVG